MVPSRATYSLLARARRTSFHLHLCYSIAPQSHHNSRMVSPVKQLELRFLPWMGFTGVHHIEQGDQYLLHVPCFVALGDSLCCAEGAPCPYAVALVKSLSELLPQWQ